MSATGHQRRRRRAAKRRREKMKNKLTLEDLEVKTGGHYYLNGEHVAHGKENAKEFIAQYNGGE